MKNSRTAHHTPLDHAMRFAMFKHKTILLSALIALLMGSCGIQAHETIIKEPSFFLKTK